MEYHNPKPTSKGPSSSSSSNAKKSNNKEKKWSVKKNNGVKLSTDPQSVAARERRQRISDRFKILQSMIPGGSKMDTVSMLEEAIHYVKFLKTQIWLHQTMINFVDNIDDESSLNMLPHEEYYFPDENNISLQQQNPSVSLDSQHTLPQLPLEEQCCFQVEEDDTIPIFDTNMKYWPSN